MCREFTEAAVFCVTEAGTECPTTTVTPGLMIPEVDAEDESRLVLSYFAVACNTCLLLGNFLYRVAENMTVVLRGKNRHQ
jgi:hypothetical protein